MSDSIRGQTAVCGLGITEMGKVYGHDASWFAGEAIRLAVEDREIEIFGDGSQLRDFVYVDDAVEAFLSAGASDVCNGHVYNVSGSDPLSLRDVAALLIEVARTGRVRHVSWPADKKAIDIGSFYGDASKFRAAVGWRPLTTVRAGLTRAVEYYRAHLPHYVEDSAPAGSASR